MFSFYRYQDDIKILFQKNILFKSFLGKEASFQRVQSRFGRKCTYVVVGNGKYEDLPCKQVSVK